MRRRNVGNLVARLTAMNFSHVAVGGLEFSARSTDRAIISPHCKIIAGRSRRPVDAYENHCRAASISAAVNRTSRLASNFIARQNENEWTHATAAEPVRILPLVKGNIKVSNL